MQDTSCDLKAKIRINSWRTLDRLWQIRTKNILDKFRSHHFWDLLKLEIKSVQCSFCAQAVRVSSHSELQDPGVRRRRHDRLGAAVPRQRGAGLAVLQPALRHRAARHRSVFIKYFLCRIHDSFLTQKALMLIFQHSFWMCNEHRFRNCKRMEIQN